MAYTTIDDPSVYFDITLWTGSGGAKTITGLNHKPDLIWTKTRSVGYNHMWSDSSRGFNANSELASNSAGIEGSLSAETYGYKSGHTADGWTMVDGTDTSDNQEDGNTNQPSVTYVGWTWAANGGTTSSNSSGSLTSTVQASTTAGFSIVTYTGNASQGATIGHGLGVVPNVVLVKGRSVGDSWTMLHTGIASDFQTDMIKLDEDGAAQDNSVFWNDTAPTSSVFSVDGAGGESKVNESGKTYVAYCFANIQGYSKFGKYTGQESANGPFVYTGFAPAWIMIKQTDQTRKWMILDNKREPFNDSSRLRLRADHSGAEDDSADNGVDFLSNGFKIRTGTNDLNANTGNFIYWAFAEHPFVSSEGVPTTAK